MAGLLANLHDDRGFDVSRQVESRAQSPGEAFRDHYAWRMADLALQFYTVGGDSLVFTGDADRLVGTLRRLDILREALRTADDFIVIEDATDLDLVVSGEKRGLALTVEGGLPIGSEDLSILRTLYRLGLRSVNLLWFKANPLGDGLSEGRGAGLTDHGRAVTREMNRLGMIPDVSQASRPTFWDIIEEATVPVIASHSNAAGCHPHPRNLTDEEIRAIAATGGLVGLNTFPSVVGEDVEGPDDLIRHASYIADLVGPEHVCFGLNIIPDAVDDKSFNRERLPESASHSGPEHAAKRHTPGVEDVTALPDLVARMTELGFSEGDVEKIAFGNIVRVLRAVLPPRLDDN